VPSQSLRGNLTSWLDLISEDATIVSLAKGVELGTTLRMSEVVVDVTGIDPGRVAVVTGPNLAKEIACEQPAATVVACTDPARAELLQRACTTKYLRPYTNTDVIGCELGGAVKNVIALACGMTEGMGYGDNTKASLITRGLAETARLAMALGADPMTLMGLAGLGDLVATCSSPLSRNRTFGEKLGQGQTTDEIYASTRQVAEGAKSCASLLQLARNVGVDAPIVEHVDAVIRGELTTHDMIEAFINRDTKAERD
jgi:glycerol-3-phosphate dehydrogenase (NAD(P)+)